MFVRLKGPLPLTLVLLSLMTAGCLGPEDDDEGQARDYRQDMREFVQNISAYAKGIDPDFIVIPQNGNDIITENGLADGPLSSDYIEAIDGIGREDFLYGYESDDEATPFTETEAMKGFMDLARDNGLKVLVTDYCSSRARIDDSYARCSSSGFISFAADHRDLDNIPAYPTVPFNTRTNDVAVLSDAKNFLYLIDPTPFGSKEAYLNALRGTDHDLLIIDAFYEGDPLTAQEVESLKVKHKGGTRPVISYLSIGEAEDYRYYWNDAWKNDPPSWLDEENPDWEGNYKVRYWDPSWQGYIYGKDGAYVDLVLLAAFDGAYLDLIDAYEYYE